MKNTFSRKNNTRENGIFGEDLASDFLVKKGMKILERNFRCRMGEVDIILRDGNVLVFAEVKLRKSDFFTAEVVNIRI